MDTLSLVLPVSFLLGLYFIILLYLSIFGIHRCYLVYLYIKNKSSAQTHQYHNVVFTPCVTVQLPIYNEMYLVERLIDSVANLDYPLDRLEIQVLDDSTDDTRCIAAQSVAYWAARGLNICHLHRSVRTGYKSGALAEGLRSANGEFIVIFDADFLPQSDFLKRTLPALIDPSVGMVQARWGHVNQDYSLLTQVIAMFLDAHFILEHGGRSRGGCFFNFNGTAGVWRRCTIEEAGGWQSDTLTEDLDLSYRAQLSGWRFIFLPEVVVPAEIPVEMDAFKIQQHRWTMGSIQTCIKVLPNLFRAKLPLRVKIEAVFHLTASFNYPLMLALVILIVPALFVRVAGGWQFLLLLDLPLFYGAMLSVVTFYALSQREVRSNWLIQLRYIPIMMAVGIGLSFNNTKAVISALLNRNSRFTRTPKYGIVDKHDKWMDKCYRQSAIWQPIFEVGLGLYFTIAVVYATAIGLIVVLPFLLLFQVGFLYVGLVSLIQYYGSHSSLFNTQVVSE